MRFESLASDAPAVKSSLTVMFRLLKRLFHSLHFDIGLICVLFKSCMTLVLGNQVWVIVWVWFESDLGLVLVLVKVCFIKKYIPILYLH